MANNSSSEREESKAKWSKLIEEFQTSGQNQTNFCKERGIKKDLFCYHLGRWRKNNFNATQKISFLPIEVPKDAWKLYIAQDLYLELPSNIAMNQLSALVHHFRKTVC